MWMHDARCSVKKYFVPIGSLTDNGPYSALPIYLGSPRAVEDGSKVVAHDRVALRIPVYFDRIFGA